MTIDLSAPDLAPQLRALDYATLHRLIEALPDWAIAWGELPNGTWRRSDADAEVVRVKRVGPSWGVYIDGNYINGWHRTAYDAKRAADAELVKRGYVLEDPMP